MLHHNISNQDSTNSLLIRLIGHFLLVRPVQLVWFDVLMGFSTIVVISRGMPPISASFFVLCSVLADAGACTFNDVGDYESDLLSSERSRNERPLIRGLVTKKAATIQGILLSTSSLLISLFFVYPYFTIICLILILWSFQYSFPPLRMDARPIFSQLFWAIFGVLSFIAISTFLEKNITSTLIDSAPYLLFLIFYSVSGETLTKDIRDYENDHLSGKRTTVVKFGPEICTKAAGVFIFLGTISWMGVFFYYRIHWLILFPFIAIMGGSLAFFWTLIRQLMRQYRKDTARLFHRGYIWSMTILCLLTAVGITITPNL
ncbi:MAG: prenyltransferase [Promethearchaeota archaeon]